MQIIGWIVIGFLLGLVADAWAFRRNPGGPVVASLVGIAGALLGGFIHGAWALASGVPLSWLCSATTAFLLLSAYGLTLRHARR